MLISPYYVLDMISTSTAADHLAPSPSGLIRSKIKPQLVSTESKETTRMHLVYDEATVAVDGLAIAFLPTLELNAEGNRVTRTFI